MKAGSSVVSVEAVADRRAGSPLAGGCEAVFEVGGQVKVGRIGKRF